MLIPFNEVGAVGILSGAPAHEVPMPAWTSGQNVRMVDGSVQKFSGHAAVFDPPSVAPHWLLPLRTASSYFWIYPSLTKCYVTDGATHYNITRQTAGADVDYNAAALLRWNGCVLGGIPILNNGVDDPQMWNLPLTSTKLAALTAWPANTKAAVIRSFKNFLIALDVTKVSTRYPRLVKWSHGADTGAVPSTWDETDPTKDAGEYDLSETGDFLVDCLTLRDINVLYKDSTTWAMQHIGPPFIFRFQQLFSEFGLLSRDCATKFFGRHFAVSRDDIIIHDGQQANSIFSTAIRKRMASALFNSVDTTNWPRCFTTSYLRRKELWFCYPELGSTYCNKALVYNYERDTIGLRDLPNVNYISFGVVSETDDQTWDADTEVWDSDTGTWDEQAYNTMLSYMLAAGTADTKLYALEQTERFNGANILSYAERLQIVLDAEAGPQGISQRVFISEVWPRMRATGPVKIYVGGQETVNSPVTWNTVVDFDPNVDKRVLCAVNTPLPAIRYESNSNISWELDGYSLKVVPAGRY